MRDLRFIIGLLTFAVVAGGCIMEPLDPEFDEEEIGSVTEGVNTAPPPATATGGKPTTSPVIDGVRSNRSSMESEDSRLNKPQPDPWLPPDITTDESNGTTPGTPTTPTAP